MILISLCRRWSTAFGQCARRNTGWYPYPFVDMRSVGYQEGLMNMAGFLAVFLAVELALVLIDRLIRLRPAILSSSGGS
jgi:hypothetical protein